MPNKILLRLVTVLCLAWASPARPQILPFRSFSIEHGLAQSVVSTMIQDAKGYLWFGTQDGLSRFDGKEFVNFGQPEGLASAAINALFEGPNGAIWIGTEDGLYALRDGKISRQSLDAATKTKEIVAVLGDGGSALLAVSKKGEIIRIAGGAASLLWSNASIITQPVAEAVGHPDGRVFLATEGNGLIAVNVKEGSLRQYTVRDGLLSDDITALAIDGNRTVWIGMRDKGLASFAAESFRTFQDDDGLAEAFVTSILSDPDGYLWVGTYRGICRLKNRTAHWLTTGNGLPVISIESLLKDREGKIWIGTYGGGVARLITERFEHFTRETGLSENLVYAIAELSSGDFLIGTDGGGVSLIRGPKAGPYPPASPFANESIYGIFQDRRGRVWIATNAKGVGLVEGGSFRIFADARRLGTNQVSYALEDRKGTVWLATDQGVFSAAEGRETALAKAATLPAERFLTIFEDREGGLWFGSRDQGLFRIARGTTTVFTSRDGLAGGRIYTISQDRAGALWVSAKGGLSKIDGNKITTFTMADGLPNNVCSFAVEDDRGYLWIGTNRGLARFDGKTFKVYTTREGLISDEFNAGAALKDSAGRLWLGSIKGATLLYPDLDTEETVPPLVDITSVKLFDRPVDASSSPVFASDENYLKFSFVAPYFTSPEDVRYRYMLEGIDDDRQVTPNRSLQYTSLGHGRYTFRVASETAGGLHSPAEASFTFTIRPPFWQTWWFLSLASLALLMTAYGIFRLRVRQIEAQKRELEVIVEERTHELAHEKEKSDTLLAHILPHEIMLELKEKGKTLPRRFDNVTVLFTDFKGFTNTSASMPADFLVGELNDIFQHFDAVIEKHGVEKIKTIGDAYMIAAGLPIVSTDHAIRCIRTAFEMQRYIQERNEASIIKWNMRAGIHSGTVVAGVVGKFKFTYDVWGDTVNIASRMESACEPGRVNITAFTYHLAQDLVDCEYRGKIEIKGKGEVDMYYVKGFKETVS